MRFRAFAASLVALGVLAGCGGEDESSPEARSTTPPTVESKPLETVPDSAPAILKVYFLQDGKVTVSSRSVVAGPAVARAALVQLLDGVTSAEAGRGLRSDIPPGTKLEDIAIDDDATAVVELSQPVDELATAQIVYTLTQFGSIRRVRLEGEEHVRGDFEEATPAILVESPLPGEAVTTPVRIDGTANTFEATFNVEVVDANGDVLGKRFVTATSGSGTRGTFDAEVEFKATSDGPGELVVFELSAEDGSRTHELRIPLQIRVPR
jgi:germination protein M